MPRFTRIEPDSSRPKDVPVFTAANENAKTDLLESLPLSSEPNSVQAVSGTHQAREPKNGEIVLFMARSITGMGGGRYLGCAYKLEKIEWWHPRNIDLVRAFLGVPPNYDQVEIWSLPELLAGRPGHVMIDDLSAGQIGIGVVISHAGGLPVVLMVDTMPNVVRMQVSSIVSSTVVHAAIYDGIGTSDVNFPVRSTTAHSVGDEILATKPLGGARHDPVDAGIPVIWEELGAAGSPVLFGKVQTIWAAGTNTVILTPVVNSTSGVATGAANVTCYIMAPFNRAAVWGPVTLNDIYPYFALSDGTYMLAGSVFPVAPTAFRQGWYNAGGSVVNMLPDFLKGHT